MKKEEAILASVWRANELASWTGKRWLVTNSERCPRIIVQIDEIVRDIARSNGDLFTIKTDGKGREVVSLGKLAKSVVQCIFNLDCEVVRKYLPEHTFSPTFDLWEKCARSHPFIEKDRLSPDIARKANVWIDSIRTKARSEPFIKKMLDARRSARKNARSLRHYVKRMFERYSRLVVIRLDLGYRHDPDEQSPVQFSSDKTRGHINEFLKFMRKRSHGLVGYCWKKEYGAVKGMHVHLLIFLNGHYVREDITWGHYFGKSWERLTQGGVYWLCNADKEAYVRRGMLGIGMIEYDDVDLRMGLDQVILYLTKTDYYARYVGHGASRVFGKGVLKDKGFKPGPNRQVMAMYPPGSIDTSRW
ncbi:MAG: inovirus-type Gp2 protein [Xanthomonadaceae bacterium]|nr:inovirus-type Gp2 protein [Xanthomonadaceae bacterium]